MPVRVPLTTFVPRRKRRSPGTVAAGPVLVAATYDAGTPSLTLTFDRAVDVAGGALVAETITVRDGVGEVELLNTPDVAGTGTATLVVSLFPNAAWAGAGVTMTAGAGTGIVAVDGGAAWAGASDVTLPFL